VPGELSDSLNQSYETACRLSGLGSKACSSWRVRFVPHWLRGVCLDASTIAKERVPLCASCRVPGRHATQIGQTCNQSSRMWHFSEFVGGTFPPIPPPGGTTRTRFVLQVKGEKRQRQRQRQPGGHTQRVRASAAYARCMLPHRCNNHVMACHVRSHSIELCRYASFIRRQEGFN
jgi:hypothetical protein